MGLYGKPSGEYKHVHKLLAIAASYVHDFAADSLADDDDLAYFDWCSELPPRYSKAYNIEFKRAFIICIAHVAAKIVAPRQQRLMSTAEELALHVIVNQARHMIEDPIMLKDEMTDEEMALAAKHLDNWYEMAVEDMDIEVLYEESSQGLEHPSDPVNRYMGFANLDPPHWFEPFNPECGDYVHPFVANFKPKIRPKRRQAKSV